MTVKLKGDPTGTQWMTLALQVTNGGTTSIPMPDLTLRYWYTFDATPVVAQTDTCSYAFTPPGTCSNIVRTWVALSPSTANADFYYQVGFTAAAGSLSPGATADFQLQFHKNDWTNYTQTNDYSFNGATAFTPTTKVTAYRQGALVHGTEPPP